MKRDMKIYIRDVMENIDIIEDFVKGMDFKEFESDRKTHLAVIRCLEVIGEAVKHVPEQIREKYPDIPWRDMAGMRDKLIHFYFGVSLEKVWQVIKEEIPPVKERFMKILKEW